MERKSLFRRYHTRLVMEAILKSLVCGFIIGFAASIIPAVITILNNADGLLLSLIVGAGVGIICSTLFYFIFFRPSQKQVANRIDRIGLHERAVTMMELEKSDSFMAKVQREDAQQRIKAENHKKLKFSVFKIPLILLAVFLLSGVALATVSKFSVEPKKDYVSNKYEGEKSTEEVIEYFTVTYVGAMTDGTNLATGIGGEIEEYAVQRVAKNEDAKTVVATPFEGYQFFVWLSENGDILETPIRTDRKINRDLLVYALFQPAGEVDPNQVVITEQNEEQIVAEINIVAARLGDTISTGYYGDYFDPYYDDVKDILMAAGDNYTEEQRAVITLYFDTLRKLKYTASTGTEE